MVQYEACDEIKQHDCDVLITHHLECALIIVIPQVRCLIAVDHSAQDEVRHRTAVKFRRVLGDAQYEGCRMENRHDRYKHTGVREEQHHR